MGLPLVRATMATPFRCVKRCSQPVFVDGQSSKITKCFRTINFFYCWRFVPQCAIGVAGDWAVIYRREIDGLRALAVVPVIAFHAGLPALSGGFVGVDVFFVISGYLITSLLIADLERGQFDLLRFYERRARRILPALFVVLLTCLPFAWVYLLPAQFKDFSQSLFATSVFSSNIFFWSQSGYFDTASELKPLLHTWSLAVEEQYYVFFPVLLWALWTKSLTLRVSLIALAVLSFVWSIWPDRDGNAVFFLIQYRMWELLAGSACAFALSNRQPLTHPVPGLIGLVLIAAPMVSYGHDVSVSGLIPLPSVVGAVLVILWAGAGTPSRWILSLGPVVWIGLISYSAYLWHQPILAFARLIPEHPPSLAIMLALSISVFPLAWATWAWVEQPFRKRSVTQGVLFSTSFAGLALFGILGLGGHISNGMPGRVTQPNFVIAGEFVISSHSNGNCFIGFRNFNREETVPEPERCKLGHPDGPNGNLILIGDSYAGQYEPFWNVVGRQQGLRITAMTTNWCFPSLGAGFSGPTAHIAYQQCLINRDVLRRDLGQSDGIILGANWFAVANMGLLQEVFDLIDTALASNKRVILMESPVQLEPAYIEAAIYWQRPPSPSVDEADTLAVHAALAARYAQTNVEWVTRVQMFGPTPAEQSLTTDGYPFSLDGGHISVYGSRSAARYYLARHPD